MLGNPKGQKHRKEEKMNRIRAGKKGFHISSPDTEGSSGNSSANMKGSSETSKFQESASLPMQEGEKC